MTPLEYYGPSGIVKQLFYSLRNSMNLALRAKEENIAGQLQSMMLRLKEDSEGGDLNINNGNLTDRPNDAAEQFYS